MSVENNYRCAAWQVLTHFRPEKQNLAELIVKFGDDIKNRAGLVDVALGTIRNLTFIDNLIEKISARKIKRINTSALNCIRIAAYELVFTNQADYAIVNEAVELSCQTASKKAAGFVNAVLRNICRAIKNKSAELKTAPPEKTLPLNPQTGCEFNMEILPDAKKFRIEYLNLAFSLPIWLVEQLLAQLGYEKTLQVCFASNRKPSVYARPNKLKTSAEKLREILQAENIDCQLVEQSDMLKTNNPGSLAELDAFKQGLFVIQDLTASSVVPFLNPQTGWKIFDLCAAPGTKTTQLAESTCDKAAIIASDIDAVRLTKLAENINRLCITSIETRDYKTLLEDRACFSTADAVIVDVPCSNTGVLAKRVEVRYRLTRNMLDSIERVQLGILKSAANFVKPGGKICYSTCSILNQENRNIVDIFLKDEPGFIFEREKLTLPSAENFDHDGGYTAIIIRRDGFIP
ncbi:MAG: transcription antitermination factor NusB [Sedimentisphaerales bacterium]